MAATLRSTVVALGSVSARRPIARCSVLAKAQKCGGKSTGLNAPVAVSGIAVAAPLLAAAGARAEETVAAAAEATTSGGFGAGEAVLLITPVVLYAAFSAYRERVNPKASFLDYFYILATVAIVGNLISIVAFNTRFF